MQLTVLVSSLLALGLAEEAKVLSNPIAYNGLPYTGLVNAGLPNAGLLNAGYAGQPYNGYAGHPYAGFPGLANVGYAGFPYGGYAGLPFTGYAGYPYAMPAENIDKQENTETETPALTYGPAQPISYPVIPAVPYAAPAQVAAPAPYAAPYSEGTQFHAQDEFGNLNYGYANINSAKQETGNTYGGVTGEYSYVDANGELQQVKYIADATGFHVADSRLPVAPEFSPEPLVAPTFNPELPVAPVDTPEVAEAKKAHFAAVRAVEEAEAAEVSGPIERKRREAAFGYGVRTVHHNKAYGYAGFPYTAGHPYAAGLRHTAAYPYAGLRHAAAYPYAGQGYGMPYYGF